MHVLLDTWFSTSICIFSRSKTSVSLIIRRLKFEFAENNNKKKKNYQKSDYIKFYLKKINN